MEFDEDEADEDEETRLIKLMGSLMVDLTFLDPKDLAKGLGFFVNQEKYEIKRLRLQLIEKKMKSNTPKD